MSRRYFGTASAAKVIGPRGRDHRRPYPETKEFLAGCYVIEPRWPIARVKALAA